MEGRRRGRRIPFAKAVALAAVHLIASAAANRSGACGLLWFTHVPKTGGTSVTTVLRKSCTQLIKVGCWGANKAKCAKYNWKDQLPDIRAAVLGVKPGVTCIHHHHMGPLMVDIIDTLGAWRGEVEARGCTFTLVTTLREPLKRLLSAISYNSPRIVRDQGIRNMADINVTEFLRDHNNEQIRYLLFNNHVAIKNYNARDGPTSRSGIPVLLNLHERSDIPWVEIALNITARFDVIGATHDLAAFVRNMCNQAGLANCKLGHLNKSRKPPANVLAKWTADAGAAPLQYDYALWRGLGLGAKKQLHRRRKSTT